MSQTENEWASMVASTVHQECRDRIAILEAVNTSALDIIDRLKNERDVARAELVTAKYRLAQAVGVVTGGPLTCELCGQTGADHRFSSHPFCPPIAWRTVSSKP